MWLFAGVQVSHTLAFVLRLVDCQDFGGGAVFGRSCLISALFSPSLIKNAKISSSERFPLPSYTPDKRACKDAGSVHGSLLVASCVVCVCYWCFYLSRSRMMDGD